MLKELGGSHLAGTFVGDCLKKFHSRQHSNKKRYLASMTFSQTTVVAIFLTCLTTFLISNQQHLSFPVHLASFPVSAIIQKSRLVLFIFVAVLWLMFQFLVSEDDISVGGDPCDGVKAEPRSRQAGKQAGRQAGRLKAWWWGPSGEPRC